MPDMIDILELLSSQHAEVDQLFEQLEQGGGDRAALFAELADKLATHAAVEEKIFYPSVMEAETSDLLHESVEEHLEVKRLLADLLELDLDRDQDEFDAKLSVLQEKVSHHAHDEEEGKLFPKLRKLLSDDERAALGNELLAMFEEMIEQEPRFQVPGETAAAAPLPSA
jgi:hemerythrin superfamily protein